MSLGTSFEVSLVTDEFPAQRASDAENVSIWWRHHVISQPFSCYHLGALLLSRIN